MKIRLISETAAAKRPNKLRDMAFIQRLMLPGIFIFGFICIILNIARAARLKDLQPDEQVTEYSELQAADSIETKCQMGNGSQVACSSATLSEIKDYLYPLESTEVAKQGIEFRIFACPDYILPCAWLTADIEIAAVEISHSNLSVIQSDAFDTMAFSNTHTISIDNGKLRFFNAATFRGLNRLKRLHIANEVMYNSYNLLAYLCNSLEEFKFVGRQIFAVNDPKRLLAENNYPMSSLRSIKFRWNNFADLINEFTFKNVRRLQSLVATGTQITALHEMAFAENRELQHLDLSDNLLLKIPVNLFDKLVANQAFVLNLSGNRLLCDCDLCYFIEFYRNHYKRFSDRIFCAASDNRTEINSTDFGCSSATPNACYEREALPNDRLVEPKASTETIETPSPPDDELVNVSCTCVAHSPEHPFDSSPVLIQVKPAEVAFSLVTVSSSQVQVILEHDVKDLNLIWFNSTTTGMQHIKPDVTSLSHLALYPSNIKTGCGLGLRKEVTINSLNENSTYVFCLIKRNDTETSPFNCRSFAWDHNSTHHIADDIADLFDINTLTFVVLAIAIMLSVAGGATVMYFIIKNKPTLLKGSPRVVVVNKDTSGVMVIQNAQENLGSRKPSSRTTSGSKSQLTTLSYSSSFSEFGKSRRPSGISIATERSYVVPNLYEAIQYQSELHKCIAMRGDNIPQHTPPPLPARMSTDEHCEDIYACPAKLMARKY